MRMKQLSEAKRSAQEIVWPVRCWLCSITNMLQDDRLWLTGKLNEMLDVKMVCY
jgi:hypothetical protein